jgi:hypothetical protein
MKPGSKRRRTKVEMKRFQNEELNKEQKLRQQLEQMVELQRRNQ